MVLYVLAVLLHRGAFGCIAVHSVAPRCIRLHRGAFGCIAVRCAVLQAVVVSIDPKRVYAPLHCAVVGPVSLVHASLLSDSHGAAAPPQCAKHDSNL